MKKILVTFSLLTFLLAGIFTIEAQTNKLNDDPPKKVVKKSKECKSKKNCCSSKEFGSRSCKDKDVKEVKADNSKDKDSKSEDDK